MRVALFVRILVMDAMRSYPSDRATCERHGSANRHKVFHPSRSLIPAMSKQPVVAHADSHAARQPPQERGDRQGFPAKHEERCDGADMKSEHEKSCSPVQRLLKSWVLFENTHGPSVLTCSYLYPP